MSTITKTFKIDGVKTDMTSVKLSDSAAAYGVKRNDTDAVVVAMFFIYLLVVFVLYSPVSIFYLHRTSCLYLYS